MSSLGKSIPADPSDSAADHSGNPHVCAAERNGRRVSAGFQRQVGGRMHRVTLVPGNQPISLPAFLQQSRVGKVTCSADHHFDLSSRTREHDDGCCSLAAPLAGTP